MDYTKLGITPVSEESPAGEDVKYDEEYERVESELSKLTSPSVSGEIEWESVIKLSANILEKKSKNILIGVYFSYALYRVHGVEGLFNGVAVIADMLENYWETLYPPKKRLKGRVNAIVWWIDKISKDLESLEDSVVESEKKETLLLNLKRVDDFLNETLDDAPLFYNLIKLLDMKLITKNEEPKEPEEEVVVVTANVSEEIQQKMEVAKQVPKVSSNVEDDFKTTVNTLNVLIGKMVETKDYRAELFTLNRAFIYLDIEALPASEKNITMLPPPDTQEVELLNSLYEQKKYEDLLFSAESRITTYIFWLDLHYYVAQALKHLGENEASCIVQEQTQYFIQKLPNLQNLSFSDSTPFATKATKKWLQPKEIKNEPTQVVEKKENRDRSSIDSIDVLNEKMNASSSVEEEVFYNIKICELLVQNSNELLIYTYVEKLLDTIEKYKTLKWSPETALKAYKVAMECLDLLENDSDSKLLDSLLKNIALLKPSLIE